VNVAIATSRHNLILNLSGANDEWLLVLLYMCFISNHTAVESLHWTTPLTFLTGQTVDVSAIPPPAPHQG
jgi:phage-related protein